MNKDNIPVNKNEIITIKVYALGTKGDGIAKYNNYVIIVPNGKLGCVYDVIIENVLPSTGFGRIVKQRELED